MWEREITYQSAKPVVYCLVHEKGQLFLKHNFAGGNINEPVKECFILPSISHSESHAYKISAIREFDVSVQEQEDFVRIKFDGKDEEIEVIRYADVPCCDILGNRMCLDFENGKELEETAFQFYWKTLLPSVVEKNLVNGYSGCDGYVVSTLKWDVYAGTYPDVDHEFQIKGRLAVGSSFEMDLVRRMMELQLRLMEEDPQQLYRDPCALQPDGRREYHVRRNSKDGSHNAVMFLVTGNIEIIESAFLYLLATKDWEWLAKNKKGLENALSLVEECMDRMGRLWSDVYYEDQVIKDGRECMSAALAADAMRKMAWLEEKAGDYEKGDYYIALEKKLVKAMLKPLPAGFWDEHNQRFTDWVDRDGVSHDHIHLLANELPVLFGYADEKQEKGVENNLEKYLAEFQRFPTFVAGRIQDYTEDEIGDGGPYDLCAAGRYWCWDFAYWCFKGRRDILEQQLLAVCEQAKADNYLMGERYDMNHVYYKSDINWHGAAHYYEYPCVFLWNLIRVYLGLCIDAETDLRIEPQLNRFGKVRMEGHSYGLEYELQKDYFRITNLQAKKRSFRLCLYGEERIISLDEKGSYLWKTDGK